MVNPLSLDALFDDGYCVQKVSVPPQLYESVQKLEYMDSGEKYADSTAPLSFTGVVQPCVAFWDELLPIYCKPFTDHYGAFKDTQYCVSSYRVGDGLAWHQDRTPRYPLNHILYLGAENWIREFGGYLAVGRGTGVAHEIMPEHGTLVTLLNWNPFIWHLVAKLNVPVPRYSVMAKSGY